MNTSALKRVGAVVAAAAILGMFAACAPAPDYPPVLVVAYSNLDGVDGFHAGQDMLIARLVDTNRDGAATAGDTVELDRYPLGLAPPPGYYGHFTNNRFVATSVSFTAPDLVNVNIGTDNVFAWTSTTDGEGFAEASVLPTHTVTNRFLDNHASSVDHIEVHTESYSGPDLVVGYTALYRTTDDPSIDVDFYA
jgi:hypothetical protein